ncbi:MAG: DUF1015 domain-containing protein [bacterium]|nr:DUF1015 domain-containing protein [bacterium]
MIEIVPFKGILYNQERFPDISPVVTPPYDVISAEQQEMYYQNHPYNSIRLILGKDQQGDNEANNKYTRAGDYFRTWLTEEILKQDECEAIYPLTQEFSYRAQKFIRKGFITLIKLEELGSGVFPHEKTLSRPKQDRLNLMLATKANFCQVFALYSDKEGILDECLNMESTPVIDIKDENMVSNQLFRLTQPTKLKKIKEVMRAKDIFIADGHHRYETALNARKILGYNFIMIYLTKMEGSGLTILPTHRLIRNMPHFQLSAFEEFFEIKKVDSCEELFKKMEEVRQPNHSFGIYTAGKNYLLVLKERNIMDKLMGNKHSQGFKQLDVSILQTLVIEHILKINDIEAGISYTHDEKKAKLLVDENKYRAALFLNPTRISQMQELSLQHELMPQKSTYFYPKLLTGLVMNKFTG